VCQSTLAKRRDILGTPGVQCLQRKQVATSFALGGVLTVPQLIANHLIADPVKCPAKPYRMADTEPSAKTTTKTERSFSFFIDAQAA